MKHKLSKDATFNPIPWIRVECIILLIIFTITAIYSQQAPPHGNYLTSDTVSPLFRIFQDDLIDTGSTIGFVLNSSTVLFSFLALLFITLNIVSFFKKGSIFVSFLFSFLCVTSIYVMMMSSIAIR